MITGIVLLIVGLLMLIIGGKYLLSSMFVYSSQFDTAMVFWAIIVLVGFILFFAGIVISIAGALSNEKNKKQPYRSKSDEIAKKFGIGVLCILLGVTLAIFELGPLGIIIGLVGIGLVIWSLIKGKQEGVNWENYRSDLPKDHGPGPGTYTSYDTDNKYWERRENEFRRERDEQERRNRY